MVKILTDSSSEFNNEELSKYGITCVKMPVNFDGVEYEDIDINEFWNKLIAGGVSKTSQPAIGVLYEEFNKAKEEGYELLCVFISSHLSNTYNQALMVKEDVGYENIHIVDSLQATVSEKNVVLEGVRLRDLGYDAKAIKEALDVYKHKVKLYACIDTLKYLARGGRMNKGVAVIGDVIHIKPIITINNGDVEVLSKAIGIPTAIKKLLDYIANDQINLDYSITPIFACSDSNLNRFMEKVLKKYDFKPLENTSIGPVIGTHIGPGGFGIVYTMK